MSDKGDVLFAKAEKELSQKSKFKFFLFGNGVDYDSVAQTFEQAAIAYRLARRDKEAGLAYERKADTELESDTNAAFAANSLYEAYKSYRDKYPMDAIRVLERSSALFAANGNFNRLASTKFDLGEIYSSPEIDDKERALQVFEESAEQYDLERRTAHSRKALLKAADLAALIGQYSRAITHYEKIANESLSNPLTKFSTKEYFVKAGLCHIANMDLVAAKMALQTYSAQDPSFSESSREYKLISGILESVSENNREILEDTCAAFDQLSPLDPWKLQIIKTIKDNINEEDIT